MGRLKITIDADRVAELAGRGLSQAEICLIIGISEDTLSRRKADSAAIAEAIKIGRARAAGEISNKLYELAMAGDLGAIVWWEKTRRGLSDKHQIEHSIRDVKQLSDDELQSIVETEGRS